MAVLWSLILIAVFSDLVLAANVDRKGAISYDTIVVGMGPAGTAASTALAKAGKKVLVLEAQDRIGGRVNTVPCGNDGVVELGAEWIHGIEDSPTYQLAIEHNVSITLDDGGWGCVWSDGRQADNIVITELMQVTLGSHSSHDDMGDAKSVGEYITGRLMAHIAANRPDLLKDKKFLDEFLRFADLIVDGYEGFDTWFDASTASHYEALGGSQDMSWHKNGYKTLFKILLNKYKGGPGIPNLTIKLNTEVTKIVKPENPSDKVVVKTKDGAEYRADNVIVTVSVGVLKDRYNSLFSPKLPAKKATAIDVISIGVVNKIVLVFSEPWWPRDTSFGFLWREEDRKRVPEEDKWMTEIAGVSVPMGCSQALTLWTNGVAARKIEVMSQELVIAKSMELLRKFLGANYTIPDPIDAHRTTWFSNPFTRGSYTFDNLQTPDHPTAREDLAEPVTDSSGEPRILFAGEASHPTHFSTVHGAVQTGQREAARLLGAPAPAAARAKHPGRGPFLRVRGL